MIKKKSDEKGKIISDKPAFPSELRLDLVSKDWIVIATGRARRPETFKKNDNPRQVLPKKDCPFCDLSNQEKPVLALLNGKKVSVEKGIPKEWTTIVIPNKFPAFAHGESLNERSEGPYQMMDGIGFHEVVVTRDHEKQIFQLSLDHIKEVFNVYQERYLDLMNEKFVNYISIFHNNGPEAGASVGHPHSQIIAIPTTDPDIDASIKGSRQFSQNQQKCVHCAMLAWEREQKKRVIFENKHFVALAPFASRVAFEIRIYPVEHHAYFERTTDEEKTSLAEAFKVSMEKLYKALNDPPYNFFIHTAPSDGRNYDHYHWHLEILPKTSTWAGFELGAGIEISTIEPEKAAEYLRQQ